MDYDVIERRLTMAAPTERISEYLVDFRRWVEWSPWEGLDPDLRRTYSGLAWSDIVAIDAQLLRRVDLGLHQS